MVAQVESRTLTVKLDITQRAKGEYSSQVCASHEVRIPLPQTAEFVAGELETAIAALASQVETFYGQFIREPEPVAEAVSVEVAARD